jgi:hypothetical protein
VSGRTEALTPKEWAIDLPRMAEGVEKPLSSLPWRVDSEADRPRMALLRLVEFTSVMF